MSEDQPIPERMTAAVLTGHGGLDRIEVREDWPVPVPAPGEVLIRVGACGVNNTDINTRAAWYSPVVTEGTTAEGGEHGFGAAAAETAAWGGAGIDFPRVQGADVAGRVVAVGERVSRAWIGERVLVDYWLRDRERPRDRERASVLGSERDGGFAQYVAVPEENAHPIESAWTDAELATFPCSYTTAENMLERARVGPGDTVLITGASGGVGSALVQLAKRREATVVGIAGAAKTEAVRDLGADAVIGRDAEDLAVALESAIGAREIDVAADLVGGAGFTTLLGVLRRGGRYVASGAIAGPIVALDLRTLYLRDLELIGATVPMPGVYEALHGYIEREEIRPLLAGTYPLAEIHRAQRDFMAKSFVGKLAIVPP